MNKTLKIILGLYAAAAAVELLMSKKGIGGEGFTLVPAFVWKWYRETFYPPTSVLTGAGLSNSTGPGAGTTSGNPPISGGGTTNPAGSGTPAHGSSPLV